MVGAIRQSVETVELEILNRVSDSQLEQAAETLHTLKETLLEMLGGEAEEAEDSDINTVI